jgi:hypothetical protein
MSKALNWLHPIDASCILSCGVAMTMIDAKHELPPTTKLGRSANSHDTIVAPKAMNHI